MLVALLGALRHRLSDDALELHRNACPESRYRRRLVVEDRVDHGLLVVATERASRGDHLVEHCTERPDVRPVIDVLSAALLRRHVGYRPCGCAGLGESCLPRRLGQAEVHDLGPALSRHHHVSRLHVAMDDALLVGCGQTLRDLDREIDRPVEPEGATFNLVPQASALDHGHGNEGLSVSFTDLVDRADVGVIQGRGSLRLVE